MKTMEQHLHVVLFTVLYKMVTTFKSAAETRVCDHSNESYGTVPSCGTVFVCQQGGSNFLVCELNPSV